MAKAPDDPNAPIEPQQGRRPASKQKPARDPAKHSKKDPARPTRAKAARPDLPPTAPALAELLNPGIAQGTAGVGAQTGLKPPADNSFDRRADFSAAHTARRSARKGFEEAPQKGYVTRAPLGPLDPDIAKHWGIEGEDDAQAQARKADREPRRVGRGELAVPMTMASQEALDRLLRQGRPEFAQRDNVWVPHRPPRPEKSEGG